MSRIRRRVRFTVASLMSGAAVLSSCTVVKPLPSPGPAAGAAHGSATETPQDILVRSTPADWRRVDPAHTLYMDLPGGRVVIELAPQFAPLHVANIETLVRQHYFDGLAVVRVKDNYVVQWGDPDDKRDQGAVRRNLPNEFDRPLVTAEPFRAAPDGDVYAPQVGFVDSWPIARDPRLGKEWLIHCYGMVGVGRGDPPDNGSGAELYAVIGHAPRHLDRNVALIGRVLQGIELMSSLPRGTGNMGFYTKPEENVPIRAIRLAADVPAAQRTPLEVLRTDTPIFTDYLAALRSRRISWFVEPTDRIEVCNIPVPVRPAP